MGGGDLALQRIGVRQIVPAARVSDARGNPQPEQRHADDDEERRQRAQRRVLESSRARDGRAHDSRERGQEEDEKDPPHRPTSLRTRSLAASHARTLSDLRVPRRRAGQIRPCDLNSSATSTAPLAAPIFVLWLTSTNLTPFGNAVSLRTRPTVVTMPSPRSPT